VRLTSKDFLLRVREVELSILVELLVCAFFVIVLAVPLRAIYASRFRVALFILPVGLIWLLYKSWRRRVTKREMLIGWAKKPVRWDGALLVQESVAGDPIGTIDPKGHFVVRWECFSPERAVYSVTQNGQTIVISTLAPEAGAILTDILHVANYPCEQWPNLDL
jgi:hypothetical protein